MTEPRLNQRETADLLQLSTRQINYLAKAGMPQSGVNGRRYYLWSLVLPWYVRFKQEEAKRAAVPSTMDEGRLRVVTAEAEMKELELAQMRSEMMTVERAVKWMADGFSRVNAKLVNLPPAIAMRVVGLTIPERMAQAQVLVDEIRAELASGDDVPV